MIPRSAMITQARAHKAHLSPTSSGPQIPGVECTSQLIGKQVHSVEYFFPDQTREQQEPSHTEYFGTDTSSSPWQTNWWLRCNERTRHALFFLSCQCFTEPLAEPLASRFGSMLHSGHVPGPHLNEKLGKLGKLR